MSWPAGQYKLFTDAGKSIELKARVILSQTAALHLTMLGPSYLGLFELTQSHRWLNIMFLINNERRDTYAGTRTLPQITSFRIVGPSKSDDELMIQYPFVHTSEDNKNIYRIFRDGGFQTLVVRNGDSQNG